MRPSRRAVFVFLLPALALLPACRKDPGVVSPFSPLDSINQGGNTVAYVPDLPDTLFNYANDPFPAHFLNDPLLNLFALPDNVTDEGATLGRVLFYDKNLSANNTISCASCHHQEKAFTDGTAFSTGFQGGLTTRNSMSVSNVRYQRRFFWDRRAATIEEQALMPIQHPVEMGMPLPDLEAKLALLPYYAPLFNAAFGSSEITAAKIADALGQFMRSMRSFRSRYDEGIENGFSNFTAEEYLGYQLYMSGDFSCNHCHTTQNFGGVDRHNNGLDSVFTDPGVGGITGNPEDIGKFKGVSLRNIAVTAPYMHDGRFETLEEVLDFYSTGIKSNPYLDDRLTTNSTTGGPPVQFNFTPEQKSALIAFLGTLTDDHFLADPKLSDPFPD